MAQAGEKGVLEQGADLWHAETSDSLQPGDARITAVAVQPPSLRELGGGPLDFAAAGIGGGEPGVNGR